MRLILNAAQYDGKSWFQSAAPDISGAPALVPPDRLFILLIAQGKVHSCSSHLLDAFSSPLYHQGERQEGRRDQYCRSGERDAMPPIQIRSYNGFGNGCSDESSKGQRETRNTEAETSRCDIGVQRADCRKVQRNDYRETEKKLKCQLFPS